MIAGQEWRDGWRTVAGAALGVGTGLALFQYVSSIFLTQLQSAFGWSRGQISGAYAMAMVGALMAPIIGRMADKHGVRPVVLVCVPVFGVALALFATLQGQLGLFYAYWFVLAFAGSGASSITYTRAVNSWFDANRGLALGVTLSGVSIFAALTPPLLNALIEAQGWRAGYLLLAGLALLVGWPTAWALLRERRDVQPEAAKAQAHGLTLGQVVRGHRFWALLAGMILINIPGAGLVSQLQPLLTDRQLQAADAAWLISLYAASVFVGRLVSGFLLDRVWAPAVAFACMAASAIGCGLLIGDSLSFHLAAAAIMLLGLSQGAEIDLLAFFISRYFGMKSYSAIFACIIIGFGVASAAGAIGFGVVFDRTGTYDSALSLGVGCFLLGGLMFLTLGRYPAAKEQTA
jgi:predicted MFS family arabinose efflux permease